LGKDVIGGEGRKKGEGNIYGKGFKLTGFWLREIADTLPRAGIIGEMEKIADMRWIA
jgi:hypothetical protein